MKVRFLEASRAEPAGGAQVRLVPALIEDGSERESATMLVVEVEEEPGVYTATGFRPGSTASRLAHRGACRSSGRTSSSSRRSSSSGSTRRRRGRRGGLLPALQERRRPRRGAPEAPAAIRKLGTVDAHMVETTPFVFRGRLYLLECVRPGHRDNPPLRRSFDKPLGRSSG